MSFLSILTKHQELKNKLIPPHLKSFLEAQEKVKPFLDIMQRTYKQEVAFQKIKLYYDILQSIPVNSLVQPNISIMREPNSSILNSNIFISKLFFNEFDFSKFDDADIELEKVEEIKHIQIDESANIKRIITDVYKDNTALLKITPREFEEMIAEILRTQGFEVELTKQTRDNGYDILAIKPVNGHAPLKYLVECKRFTNNKVGVGIIRGFKNVIDSENANRGIIVATSYFTRDAHNKRKETPYLLDFRDKDDVMK